MNNPHRHVMEVGGQAIQRGALTDDGEGRLVNRLRVFQIGFHGQGLLATRFAIANGFRPQRVPGMWIGVMMVVMAVIMRMAALMIVAMPVMMMVILVETAGPGAEMITKRAILDIASGRRNTLPLDMMVVAFLGQANLCLEPEHL